MVVAFELGSESRKQCEYKTQNTGPQIFRNFARVYKPCVETVNLGGRIGVVRLEEPPAVRWLLHLRIPLGNGTNYSKRQLLVEMRDL